MPSEMVRLKNGFLVDILTVKSCVARINELLLWHISDFSELVAIAHDCNYHVSEETGDLLRAYGLLVKQRGEFVTSSMLCTTFDDPI